MLYKENTRKSLKYILKLFAANLGEPIRHLAESSAKSIHSRGFNNNPFIFYYKFLNNPGKWNFLFYGYTTL
jgi:hypothetical protein